MLQLLAAYSKTAWGQGSSSWQSFGLEYPVSCMAPSKTLIQAKHVVARSHHSMASTCRQAWMQQTSSSSTGQAALPWRRADRAALIISSSTWPRNIMRTHVNIAIKTSASTTCMDRLRSSNRAYRFHQARMSMANSLQCLRSQELHHCHLLHRRYGHMKCASAVKRQTVSHCCRQVVHFT